VWKNLNCIIFSVLTKLPIDKNCERDVGNRKNYKLSLAWDAYRVFAVSATPYKREIIICRIARDTNPPGLKKTNMTDQITKSLTVIKTSKVRFRFKLTEQSHLCIHSKGIDTISSKAVDFVTFRLAPAFPKIMVSRPWCEGIWCSADSNSPPPASISIILFSMPSKYAMSIPQKRTLQFCMLSPTKYRLDTIEDNINSNMQNQQKGR
jgi:hypothetical protein